MSSHHIVREGQEPALIIANGEVCSQILLDQLLEWSPFIIVLDGALPAVLSRGIKCDVVLGDFDHFSSKELSEMITPDTLLVHTPDQNKTDLEKAIEYLIEKKFQAVNIVWATGKRSDHYINNIATLARYKHQIQLTILDDYSRIYPIFSGFKKYFEAGSNISLIPLNRVENLQTENLVWNLNNETLEFPFACSSSNKMAVSSILSVHFSSGELLLMECKD